MQADGVSRLRVEIYGTEYTLRGRTSIQHLHWVAEKVDTVMHQIAAGNPSLDPKRVAVLAAINIADELRQLQEEWEEWVKLQESEEASRSSQNREGS